MTRGGSRTAATSKMERLVIKPLTIITKRSILGVAAVLDPPLNDAELSEKFSKIVVKNIAPVVNRKISKNSCPYNKEKDPENK